MKTFRKVNHPKRTGLINKQYCMMFLCLFIFLLNSCTSQVNKDRHVSGPSVYLLNDLTLSLEEIPLNVETIIDSTNATEVVNYTYRLLSNGVTSSNLLPTIPEEVVIRYFSVENKNLIVNFSDEYYDLDNTKEIFLRSSFVKTLTSFKLFDSVEFFVNGVPIKLNSMSNIGRQYTSDVLLSYDEVATRNNTIFVTLYLPNEDKSKLIPTYMAIEDTPNKKIEELVVTKLLSETSIHIFSKDIRVINIYTHSGVCFVDFSKEFQTSFLPTGISERIAIYALVNSLTDLNNITNVQILIEGEIGSTFQGTLSLDRMFSKNYALIEY